MSKNIKIFQQLCRDFGYKEVVEFLQGNIEKQEMIDKIKMQTRRYAKRQITWFKKSTETYWINGEESIQKNLKAILKLI